MGGGWGIYFRFGVLADAPGRLLREAGAGSEGVCELTGGGSIFGGVTPRASGDEAGHLRKGEAQDLLPGARGRQMHADHRLHFDHASGDLDEAQAQGVELRDAPHRAFGHRLAQTPHQPVGAGVQEQPELIGRSLGA